MAQRPIRCNAALLIAVITLNSFGVFGGIRSFTINRFGDVIIKNDGENFQCDKIICPKGTVRCMVTKAPDTSDPNTMIRQNICYGLNDEILAQNSTSYPAVPGILDNLKIIVADDGISSSSSVTSSGKGDWNMNIPPIDSEALQESIRQQVQSTLDDVDQSLKQSLGSLWHGFN